MSDSGSSSNWSVGRYRTYVPDPVHWGVGEISELGPEIQDQDHPGPSNSPTNCFGTLQQVVFGHRTCHQETAEGSGLLIGHIWNLSDPNLFFKEIHQIPSVACQNQHFSAENVWASMGRIIRSARAVRVIRLPGVLAESAKDLTCRNMESIQRISLLRPNVDGH